VRSLSKGGMFSFLPSAERARELDNTRHLDLADSLDHVLGATSDVIPELAENLEPVVASLRNGARLGCAAFGEYFEMTDALIDGDASKALRASAHLSKVPGRTSEIKVTYRGSSESVHLDSCLDRRLGQQAKDFASLPPEDATEFPSLLCQGLELLDTGYPELAAEIREIIHEVVLAQAHEGSKMEFDGASHYQFWGLLFLNPKHHRDRLAVAEVLAHEAGHSLLFGLMRTEALVRNPDDDHFASPLRADPRPMDGIFHATFVSARMALAMETLAASEALTNDERVAALAAAKKDRENFSKGETVVRQHGDLTETGAAIMDNARRWINAANE